MKIFISAMPGCGNFGDDLIFKLLHREINRSFEGAEIGYLCGNAGVSVFAGLRNSVPLLFPIKSNLKSYYTRKKKIIDFVRSCDLIYVGGGGLFQDSHHPFTIHFFLKWIQYAKCPLVITGVGVGPINYKHNFFYLKRVLRLKGVLTQVRDSESHSILKCLEINNLSYNCDIVEGCDLLNMTLPQVSEVSQKRILGCSIRPWGGLSVQDVADLIVRLIREQSIDHTKFFVFEYGEDNLSEYVFQMKVIEAMGDYSSEILVYNGDLDFLRELGSVNIAIASRYHANIIWQKLNIPVIPIAYAPKVSSLYSKFGFRALTIEELFLKKLDYDFHRLYLEDEYFLPKHQLDKLQFGLSMQLLFFWFGIFSFLADILVSLRLRIVKKIYKYV
jgi:polysaccharide pyruvyl transferase WcaK-like protein